MIGAPCLWVQMPKARILDAVREARGEGAAQLIDHLKKSEMAQEAERLLAGSGWLSEVLRSAWHDETAISEDNRDTDDSLGQGGDVG